MSDAPQGEGWWQASDGKWYPPQPTAPAPGPTAGPPSAAPAGPTPGPGEPPYPADPTAVVVDPSEDEPKSGNGKLIAGVVLLLLLIAGVLAAVFLAGGDDDVAVDTSPSTTKAVDIGDATGDLVDDGPIEFNTEYKDALKESRTEARYTLDAPDGAVMTLTVTNDAASTSGVFTSFESSGERFANFRVAPGATESQTVYLDHDGGAQFDLIFTEGPAAYTFEVALKLQNDGDQGGDAGDDFGSGFTVKAGGAVVGQLGGQDQTDHYLLKIEPGTEFTLSMDVDRGSERGVFVVVALEGDRLFSERVQPGADAALSLLLSDQDEGTLEIILTEGPANYSFTADFVEQTEGGTAGDAPADLANARTIDPATPLTGRVGGRDAGDYYIFSAPSASLQVTASAAATSERGVFVTIEDAAGSRIGSFRVQPGAEQVETYAVEAGTNIRVILGEGPAEYTLTFA